MDHVNILVIDILANDSPYSVYGDYTDSHLGSGYYGDGDNLGAQLSLICGVMYTDEARRYANQDKIGLFSVIDE
jgi:hypothetical protein